MKLLTLYLFGLFFISAMGVAQSIVHEDGYMGGMDTGKVYTMPPNCDNDIYQIEPQSELLNGVPTTFTINAPLHSHLIVKFELPGLATTTDNQFGMPCSFSSSSLLNTQSHDFLNPLLEQEFSFDSDSTITLQLGATVNSLDSIWQNYSASVKVLVFDSMNTILTSDSASFVFDVTPQWWGGYHVNTDAQMTNLAKGYTYELHAQPNVPILNRTILGEEAATPGTFWIGTDPNSKIHYEFKLPTSFVNEYGDSIPCSFSNDAFWYREKGQIINPHQDGFLVSKTTGGINIDMGVTVSIPKNIPSGEYYAQLLTDVYYTGLTKQGGPGQYPIPLDALITFALTVSDAKIPQQFALYQNYPNPFNPSTTIKYDMPEQGNVNVAVYDLLGKQVAQLVDGFQYIGEHSITWNAEGMPSGVYYYKITTSNFSKTKKLMLMR